MKKQLSYLREVHCTFIERNQANFENLQKVVDREIKSNPSDYEGVHAYLENDEFANVAKKVLSGIKKKPEPSFFFIDPFGFKGVPFETIKDLLRIPKVEVFITFMARDIYRFLESSKHKISIEELYGTDNVKDLLSEKYSTGAEGLLRLYRDRLHYEAGVKYTLPFEVNADDKLQTTYYLIHATNHPLGCSRMKEVMFKAGTAGRFGYLGPAQGQLSLTQYEGLSKFKEFMLKKFEGETLSFNELINRTLMDTDFVETHYIQALKELESEGKVLIKGKGPKGGMSTNKKNVKIIFPKEVVEHE
ncbi:MAG: three-Cys-motif partner protein TcmP [Promethearchaeota archaeon]